jgi:peptidoglycan hydrolase-like protein with peptidoglycan-binding domain
VTTTTLPAGTLTVGSTPTDIAELQHQLNDVTATALALNGVYDDGTRTAVRNFQTYIGVAATGVADPVTRWILAEAATRAALSPLGDGSADGCEVAVIGDSLMAGAEELHADTLAEVGCVAAIDGKGGRSLSYGWQCRVEREGRRPVLQRFDERIPGNDTCAPSGLTLLASWAAAGALGDVVVIGLGTNDSGLYERSGWKRNWAEALRLAGGRPVVFLTTQALAGSTQVPRQHTYSVALRQWCASQALCVLAEWANTAAANDAASYVDSVHLNAPATRARAAFVSEVVAALVAGRPIPNPLPPATTTIPTSDTTTTTSTTTSTTAIVITATTTTTTQAIPTEPPTTTTTAPATTTSSPTTTTVAPTTTASTTTSSVPATPPDNGG